MTIKTFLKELNPACDLDRARLDYHSFSTLSDLELGVRMVGDRAILMVKPLVRGGLMGAGIGALLGAFSEDFRFYVNAGIFSGITVDAVQTFVRLGSYTFSSGLEYLHRGK